jgi:hypothetical protein
MQASQNLDVHTSQLRDWVKKPEARRRHAASDGFVSTPSHKLIR